MCSLYLACSDDDADVVKPWAAAPAQGAERAVDGGAVKSTGREQDSSNSLLCLDGKGKLGPEPERLQWKRGDALQNDLMTALELGANDVCKELGGQSCVDAHRVPLGRSDPYGTALYAPVARPLATTTIAGERVTLAACTRRAELDREGSPKVYTMVDLHTGALDLDDDVVAAGVREQLDMLYQRLLGREATADEQEFALELARGPDGKALSGLDFAKLACFAVASTTEFTLF
jgi:hypothetical protein